MVWVVWGGNGIHTMQLVQSVQGKTAENASGGATLSWKKAALHGAHVFHQSCHSTVLEPGRQRGLPGCRNLFGQSGRRSGIGPEKDWFRPLPSASMDKRNASPGQLTYERASQRMVQHRVGWTKGHGQPRRIGVCRRSSLDYVRL